MHEEAHLSSPSLHHPHSIERASEREEDGVAAVDRSPHEDYEGQ